MAISSSRVTRRASLYTVLVLVTAIFSVPLVWLVLTSLKTPAELAESPVSWLPHDPLWSNFKNAWDEIPYLRYAATSLLLSTVHASLATLTSAMTGFGFARLRAPGKRLLFVLVLSTLMLPQIVTLIPTYLIFARVHLVDNYWPWVLWGLAGSAYLVFLFRQAFSSLPIDLEDAAILDGCGYFRIFGQIFLPMTKAVVATGFILSFVATWGDYVAPALLLNMDNTTLAVGLSQGYTDPAGNPLFNLLAAGAVMYVLPVVALFVVAQRAFISGFVTSGMK